MESTNKRKRNDKGGMGNSFLVLHYALQEIWVGL